MRRSAPLALALVLLAGVARAQPRDVAKADALFRDGRALMKKGDYETACPKLEESYRLDPAAGTGINLGDCFEKQGKVASALLAYQAARALLQPGDPRIGPVEKEIASLDKRAPRLTIKLATGAPEGTTVKRDGREVEASKLGVPVAVNPGKVKVTVSAPGRDTAVFRVSLVEGKRRELEVGPGERDVTPAGSSAAGADDERRASRSPELAAPSVEVPPGSAQRTWGYLLVGVGVVGLGLGSYFLVQFESGKSDLERLCPGGKCAPENERAFDSRKDTVDANGIAAPVGLVAGGIAGGIGIFLLASGGAERDAALRVSPGVARRTWAVNVGGMW
ncbi:MAG: hypothetical protein IPM13_16810 [Phycisphaerales bacterium]|nr:hypothetical protein [Phycisphaerales bacterium]